MSEIRIRNLSKTYKNGVQAVRNFNLQVEKEDIAVLVGPSGCGKTTTLRMIAGLEEISSGELWSEGRLLNLTEPGKRNFSMVFQNYALYPNMNIYDNIAFGLRVHGLSRKETDERVRCTAARLGISALLDKKPRLLSGGQKQRAAIAAAIVRQPAAYLMDEPFSNLDAKRRVQMRIELAKLHKLMNAPIIYVTHDQTEAMTLGTKIIVMKDGEIQQTADPETLYREPRNRFVAGFIGSPAMNFLKGKLIPAPDRPMIAGFGWKIDIREREAERLLQKGCRGRSLIVGIRPENLYCSAGAENAIPVKISIREQLGANAFLYGENPESGEKLCIRVPTGLEASVGETVCFSVLTEELCFFDRESGENILFSGDEKNA